VPAQCRKAHANLVRGRIATLAPVLAMLTLAWVPLDLAWLGARWVGATDVLVMRVGLAMGLVLLALRASRLRWGVAVHGFLWLQALGFGLLQWRVDAAPASAVGIGYGLFPFLLAAQLAVLPLPWLRALLAAVPAALLLALSLRGGSPRATAWGDAWLFALIASVGVWASAAQLRLLADLLGARSDAAHDPLTGLANRRAADARLEAERLRAGRSAEPLSVLMLDLDHFKRINDLHGHAAGDAVLVAVAQVLREELRGIDLAARHGGEEFLALLPGTDARAALEVAERLRARIAGQSIAWHDRELRITTSIGAATLDAGESVPSLIGRADAALYQAKAAGRDRCIAAPTQEGGLPAATGG
jgi:diguanylate cyclase (GGDEF)-like protein